MKIYIEHKWAGVGNDNQPDGWQWVITRNNGVTVASGWRRFKTIHGCRKEADRVLEALKKTKGKYT